MHVVSKLCAMNVAWVLLRTTVIGLQHRVIILSQTRPTRQTNVVILEKRLKPKKEPFGNLSQNVPNYYMTKSNDSSLMGTIIL